MKKNTCCLNCQDRDRSGVPCCDNFKCPCHTQSVEKKELPDTFEHAGESYPICKKHDVIYFGKKCMLCEKETPQPPSVEEHDCKTYDHIPEAYDVSFWHCKVCGAELSFYSISEIAIVKSQAYERGRREENQEWLEGNRCQSCGGDNDSPMSDTCIDCLENN